MSSTAANCKLKEFHYTAWRARRYHRDDPDQVPPGAFRDPDRYLEITEHTSMGEVLAFLAGADGEKSQVFGVLIRTAREKG